VHAPLVNRFDNPTVKTPDPLDFSKSSDDCGQTHFRQAHRAAKKKSGGTFPILRGKSVMDRTKE
jgi:hypothetical protein